MQLGPVSGTFYRNATARTSFRSRVIVESFLNAGRFYRNTAGLRFRCGLFRRNILGTRLPSSVSRAVQIHVSSFKWDARRLGTRRLFSRDLGPVRSRPFRLIA